MSIKQFSVRLVFMKEEKTKKPLKRSLKEKNFTEYQHIHFVGIGGSGMSSLAELLHTDGRVITGSDLKHSKVAETLAVAGIKILIGQDEQAVPSGTEAIVYSAAIPELDQKFFRKLKKIGVPLYEYHEAVGEYAKQKHTVAISGTHGKTTTTAMVASILKAADIGASALVGGVMNDTGSGVYAGNGDTFVVEADEYKNGFLYLSPSVLVITNIDLDHVNFFTDISAVQNSFKQLIRRVPADGVIICDPSDPKVIPVIAKTKHPVVDYTSVSLEGINLKIPGEHNRKNAKAALAAVGILGISPEIAIKALCNFSGTGRRFEDKGKMKNGATVFDDYAHNPQKVAAAIAGAREAFPDKKLTVVFQPHLFSRTRAFLDEFASALSVADSLIVTDIYAAREKMDLSVTAKDLVDRIRKLNKNVLHIRAFDDVVSELNKSKGEKDLIMTVGAGDITKVSEMLIAA